MGKMRRVFRSDSRPWTPPEVVQYVTPELAAHATIDHACDGPEAGRARQRMLERQQRRSGSGGAAGAGRGGGDIYE